MPPALIIRRGEKFNHLQVIREVARLNRRRAFLCRCRCGKVVTVRLEDLRHGSVKSCGCWRSEATTINSTRHGGHGTFEYGIWQAMRERCLNPNAENYVNYGGRGISICPTWDDFSVFLRDMGAAPSRKHTIERIDNNADYSPVNCRWATRLEQANNSRKNVFLEFHGERLTLSQWGRKLGIGESTLRVRIRLGWSIEKILTTPVRRW